MTGPLICCYCVYVNKVQIIERCGDILFCGSIMGFIFLIEDKIEFIVN